MRASQDHMNKVKDTIVKAASEGFKEQGYGGLGINALAERAGLTSGAFYGHFASKDQAFQAVVSKGMHDYAATINSLIENHGEDWAQELINFYLGGAHVEDVACGCAVPALSVDVARASDDTKAIYTEQIREIATAISRTKNQKSSQDALALMSLLAGSVMIARSLNDPKLSKELLAGAHRWAIQISER